MDVQQTSYLAERHRSAEVTNLVSIGIAAAIGAAVGAVALGVASAAAHGDVPGLAIALQHIPPTTHGYEVVTAVKNALAGGAAGGGIGAAVAAVAKAAAKGAAAMH